MTDIRFREGVPVAQPILHKLHNLGYYLLPRTHAHSPGHSGLLVLLHSGPGGDVAFVPHAIETRVVGHDAAVHWTSFEASTPVSSVRTVAPGKFVLRDAAHQEAEFFVFGGALTAESTEGGTIYSLYSRAPVLAMSRTSHTVATHLAVEVEVLLAEQRALLYADEQSFLQRLVEVEAFPLYLTCLQTILNHYEQVTALRRQYVDFYHALLAEKAWLQETGQWPERVPPLPQLLKLHR